MAAYNAPWQLGTATRNQDYRVQRRPSGMAVDSQNWVAAVQSSSARALGETSTAMQVAGGNTRAGIDGITDLASSQLRGSADITAASLVAGANVYSADRTAQAMIDREKAARPSALMQGLRFAGGIGLLGYGIATA